MPDDLRLKHDADSRREAARLFEMGYGYSPGAPHDFAFPAGREKLLHQVISESYERRSVAFTTNVVFNRWGTVFADDKLAAAIVDRVVHHGRLVEFGRPSHRLEESLMLGKSGR